MADQTQWFVRKGDKTHGPFTSQNNSNNLPTMLRSVPKPLSAAARMANGSPHKRSRDYSPLNLAQKSPPLRNRNHPRSRTEVSF